MSVCGSRQGGGRRAEECILRGLPPALATEGRLQPESEVIEYIIPHPVLSPHWPEHREDFYINGVTTRALHSLHSPILLPSAREGA